MTPSPASPTFTLACVGDVMLPEDGPDWERAAMKAWQPVEDADAVLVNLEVPVTESPVPHSDKRYCFRCRAQALRAFDKRFIIGLANNHVFDFGEKGLLDTVDALRSRGLRFTGAGRNLREAGPEIFEIGGFRLGVICAADPRYQAAGESSAGTYPAIPGLLRQSLRELREQADCLVASIHCGQEFLPVPSPRQLRIADLCIEEGVSVVSFHHAHCLSGLRQSRTAVVFYGTGNYVFPRGDTPAAYSRFQESAAWSVVIDRCRKTIERVEARPVTLSDAGWPSEASPRRAAEIRRRIQRYSRRIAGGKLEPWRALEMAGPVYLWMNAVNYLDIARRQGLAASVRALAEGIRANMTRGRVG